MQKHPEEEILVKDPEEDLVLKDPEEELISKDAEEYSHITERGQPCFAQTTLVTCPYQVRDLQEHLQDIQKQLLDLF